MSEQLRKGEGKKEYLPGYRGKHDSPAANFGKLDNACLHCIVILADTC